MKNLNRPLGNDGPDSLIVEDLREAYHDALYCTRHLHEYLEIGLKNLESTILRTEHGIVFDLDTAAKVTDMTRNFTIMGFTTTADRMSIVEVQHDRLIDYYKTVRGDQNQEKAKEKEKENQDTSNL
jgi:hypothetical protein